MKAELFDTHIHLDRLPPERVTDEIFQAQSLGITSFLVPGIFPANWDKLVALAEKHSAILLAPGIHPLAAETWSDDTEGRLWKLLAHPAVVAIGEIGLDNKIPVPMSLQERIYRAQLHMAVAANYPLILHCRGDLNRCLKIFSEEGGQRVGGILHAFSGSLEMARQALRLNLLIGFGGGITWPEARRAPKAMHSLPATAIVLESDAPDQSPAPHRREQNRPLWLSLILNRGAEIRSASCHELAAQTTANARRILRLDHRLSVPHKE